MIEMFNFLMIVYIIGVVEVIKGWFCSLVMEKDF